MPYMCYSCNEEKEDNRIRSGNQGVVCKDCETGFIEEIEQLQSLVYEGHVAGASAASGGGGGASATALLPGPDGVVHLHLGSNELEQVVQALFHQVFGIVGSLEDYALGGDSVDDLVTQLLNSSDAGGPPPASSEDLQRIQSTSITQQQARQGLQCFICFEEFAARESVSRLPCQHHYHADCILPWLRKHGTCPVCRRALSGEDTSTRTFSASAAGRRTRGSFRRS